MQISPRLHNRRQKFSRGFYESIICMLGGDLGARIVHLVFILS